VGGRVPRRIAVVDLFCGAGGLSLGLRNGGLTIAAGIDIDPNCRFPFEKNIKARFLHRNVAELTAPELAELFADAKIRVLAACAPCQPFSGYTSKRNDIGERWKLLLEVSRLASEVQPDVITVENVSRLAKRPVWSDFVRSLEAVGYHVKWDILDASNFGVPQRRKRLVLLGSLLGPIDLPVPISLKKPATVRTAIGSLPKISCGMSDPHDPLHSSRNLTKSNLKRIRASKPAGTWRQWPESLVTACHKKKSGRTYPSVYGRMSWDKPSPTITTQFYGFGNGRFGHPEQNRALSLREGAILQSFPANFQFLPKSERVSFNAIGKLIGNAVPPRLAQAIGRTIKNHAATIFSGSSRNCSVSK
jgi:DNA (cytosine-5)-methyltransferase 1